jgi:hypothetical protein
MSREKTGENRGLIYILCLAILFFLVQLVTVITLTPGAGLVVCTVSLLYVVSIIPKEAMILTIVLLLSTHGSITAILIPTLIAIFLDAIISIVVILQFDALMRFKFISDISSRFTVKITGKRLSVGWGLFLFLFHLVPVQGFGPLVTAVIGKLLKLNSKLIFGIVVSGTAISALAFSCAFFYGISMVPGEFILAFFLIAFLLPSALSVYKLLKR